MLIIKISVIVIFFLAIWLTVGYLTTLMCITRTKGFPDARYKITEALIHGIYVVHKYSNKGRGSYFAYVDLSFKTEDGKTISLSHPSVSSVRFSEIESKINQQFGEIPFYIAFDRPLIFPDDITHWIEKNEFLNEVLHLKPRTSSIRNFPIVYDSRCPALFLFKNEKTFKKSFWLYVFFFFAMSGGISLLFMAMGQFLTVEPLLRFLLSLVFFGSAPLIGMYMPGIFVHGSKQDRNPEHYIIVNENFSKNNLVYQVKKILTDHH